MSMKDLHTVLCIIAFVVIAITWASEDVSSEISFILFCIAWVLGWYADTMKMATKIDSDMRCVKCGCGIDLEELHFHESEDGLSLCEVCDLSEGDDCIVYHRVSYFPYVISREVH
ncbi:hypothetical protein SAMN05216302_101130 [Nitrosomonas aestuarii]|uniref:Uncharacterized protein n=1 Tax=Nitrosomonas aestuarii TaxID=52441 RepID=A0A1I4B4E9_9PROT|nr:hypothetical protein [Nitrosomonas aestuarii]SFK63738.1 hypothetical protein SAMN05216302_101130 [Nitrosomonas aestuarii]